MRLIKNLFLKPNTIIEAQSAQTVHPPVSGAHILTTAKGSGIVFVGNLFQYGIRFVTAVLLARLLGSEQLGLCNLAMSAATIAASLASLGLPLAMVRYVSLFASRRDTAGLWGTLQTGLGLTTISSAFTSMSLFVLAAPIAEQLFHEPRLIPLLRMISLVVPFLQLNSIIVTAIQGFKKMQYVAIGQDIVRPATRLIFTVTFAIVVGLNATMALVTFNTSIVVAFVVLLYLLNRLFSLNRPLSMGRRDTKEVLRFALPAYLSNLFRTFGSNLQTILLGTLNTLVNVGIFTIASQINIVGQMFHAAVFTASAPIVSELYDRGEREQMGRFYQMATKWTFTMNLPLFLIVLLFPGPILSIFGESFVGGVTALTILAWANLVNTGTGICSTMLDMTGNTSLKLINSVTTLVFTLGLNILLIPRWGLIGAAIAALVGATIINLLRLVEVFILFRLLPYSLSFIKPVAAGLVALAVAWGVRSLSPLEVSIVYTAMNVLILLVVYVSMLPLLGFSQEDRMVLNRIGQRMSAALSK